MPIQISLSNAIGALQGLAGGGPGPGPGYTPLLDDYPDAAAAYSVRLLRTAYSGSALRVRRTVAPFDEQDIGFDGVDLDEAAIVSFGGADSLTVSVWYDQSGNGVNTSQTTATAQPQIYNGSAVITENGKPALDVSSGQDFQASSVTLNAYFSTSSVVAPDVADGFILEHSNNSNNTDGFYFHGSFGETFNLRRTVRDRYNSTSGWIGTNQTLITLNSNGTPTLHKDGAALSLTPVAVAGVANTGTTQVLNFFSRGGSSQFYDGKAQEVVIWNDDQSSNRTGIETNINDYFKIVVNDEVATSGFLFDYPNAATAYSVRQLNNNAEFAMQVERSDGRTKNIGFDSNSDLDTQAIIDFAGASAATVSAWYDQSGAQNHARQNNPSAQPQIYDGAAVITENGKPAIRTIGQTGVLSFQDITIDAAGGYTSFAAKGSQTDWGSPVTAGAFIRTATSIRVYGNGSNIYSFFSSNNFDRYVLTARKDNRDYDMYKGTTNIDSRTLGVDVGNTFQEILKGAFADPNSVPDNGFLHEVIIYDSALSDSDVTDIQNNILTKFY